MFDDHLAELATQGRLRKLAPRMGKDFSSNDYLGLSQSPRLVQAVADALARGVPVGSGGSRLLRGNHAEHEALEAEAAAYFGSETALYFSSGFAANAALFSTLPQRGDLVVYDTLIHASAHEGMRIGRAETAAAAHNDVNAFEDSILRWRSEGGTGRVWIAIESLYSMDGDFAPLTEFEALAKQHDAMLLIDEAHATGVFGIGGLGLAAHLDGQDHVIILRTCGKALGCEGALLCAPAIIRDFIVNRARGFIFSTAPSPLMASAVRTALQILDDEPQRQQRLQSLVRFAADTLEPIGAVVNGSQILPLIIGDEGSTMRAAARLQESGFDVRGIRPPTVPAGTSRLRICITLNSSEKDITALASALGDALL
jgi:8-amino-7-oxononanoate synthase